MPRYRVLETSYIGDRIFNPGDEIEYAGRPGSQLEPLDASAKKAAAVAKADAGASGSQPDAGNAGSGENASQ